MLQEKDRQLAVLKEELNAVKFDQATRQLEKERENQVTSLDRKDASVALSDGNLLS